MTIVANTFLKAGVLFCGKIVHMKKAAGILLLFGLVGVVGFLLVYGDTALTTEDTAQFTSTATLSDESLVITVPASEWQTPQEVSPDMPDGKSSNWFYSVPYTVPKELKVTGFEVAVEGAEDSVIHHVSVVSAGKLPVLCPFQFQQKLAYELFSASRNTLDPMHLPDGYAMFVQPDEQLVVEFMEHVRAHPHGAHQSEERVLPKLVVTMYLDDQATKPAEFVRLRLDDTPCAEPIAHQAFTVPAQTEPVVRRATTTRGGSERYVFPAAGEVLLVGGNFWPMKGGQDVVGYINEESVWEFTPQAGTQDWLWNIPHQAKVVPFEAGDEISLSSQYVNPYPEPVLDASGMLGVYYALEPSE